MLKVLKDVYVGSHASAERANFDNIRHLCASMAKPGGRLLDLGCDTGAWTLQVAAAARAFEVHGVEIVESAAATAAAAGITVHRADLNAPLPLESETFDVIHSNQVIEHVNDVDLFVSEVHRLLKPGGAAVISTENGSSWHNVFAAVMGWQIFSLTNVSGKVAGLGNPFAVHRNTEAFSPTWRHKTIMNYRGLLELFEAHGFRDTKILGAGYYPLPAALGRVDPRHAAFLAVGARRALTD